VFLPNAIPTSALMASSVST